MIGGVESIISAHARRFAKAGYPTRLWVGKGGEVAPGVKTIEIPELVSRGGPNGAILRTLGKGKVPSSFEKAVAALEKRLSYEMRHVDLCMIHNVMTMHFNLVLTTALARLMRRNRRCRFVAWTHDLTFADARYAAWQHDRYPWDQLKKALPGCDYCAISEQRRHEIGQLFGVPEDSIPVIPDGILTSGFLDLTPFAKDLFEREGFAEVDLIAFTPARILRRKNLDKGMEIIAALKRKDVSVRWLISGAPDPHNADSVDYYKALIQQRDHLQLQSDVIFLSELAGERISNKDIKALYRLSDMLLFPSEIEGFGLPVIEAGLCGLLLCISDIPALREIGGRRAVYIRTKDSSEAVAGRILKKLERRDDLLFKKRIMSTYDWDVVFRNYLEPAVIEPSRLWNVDKQKKQHLPKR